MSVTKKVKTHDGCTIEYVDDMIGEGGMKQVYFTPDKSSVVAFFKDKQDYIAKERLENIIGKYNPTNDPDTNLASYWSNLYCWPTKIVTGDKLGIIAPTYQNYFKFETGQFTKGKDKTGEWFASARLRKLLDPSEKGTWINYFKICILISRAVRKMHIMGLAHSDLSYKNVLIDPKGGHASIIDIDGLVVPNKYPPDVLGTPDFIAPEVYKTIHLDKNDKNRKLPCRATDLHALPVLIYMYLLYRHPLKGGKVHDLDPQKDNILSMGEKALFVEHPTDKSNRPKEKSPAYLPWADVNQIPYTVCGPYLKALFDKAFIDGLHQPHLRPTADQWEKELIRTVDLLQPCGNSKCEQKWFVFDNTMKPKCPFCGWQYKGQLPILNLYSARKQGRFAPDNHRLMVYHNQYIYQWHMNKRIFPGEKLTSEQKKPVGYFSFHKGKWVLVNQNMPHLKDCTENKEIPKGAMVELTDGKQILLSNEENGRLVFVQMVDA